ncbi:MAG: hypothetical protein HRT53_11320 [Colwellia sp.]|nr:hypothetical protein [Colwellia sp.]
MNFIYKRITPVIILSAVIAFTFSIAAQAEVYLAIKNNLACSACHVNPIGGGLRNDFGRIYGQTVLPSKTQQFDSKTLAKLTQFLTLGTDARFNASYQKNEAETSKGFSTESAQIYLHFSILETGLSFYVDEQVAPGSAINREAFVMYNFAEKSSLQGNYLKAGKLFIPYGLRIEDDSAFIRQVTGMNFDNSDNGIEYGGNFGKTTVNLYLANGTSQATNNDDSLLYGTRIEHLFPHFRLGASAMLNDGDHQTKMFNVFAGTQWRNIGLLAEVDYINLEAANTFTKQDISQLVGLIEMNYQWRKGWNFKLTAEYFDPDNDVDENEQTRYSFITEYTPLSNIQLRLGIRVKQDIPQIPEQNYDVIFLQSHFYF